MTGQSPVSHDSLWTYYDRRAPKSECGSIGGQRYFLSVGVPESEAAAIKHEHEEVMRCITALRPATFVDVGAGPGPYTRLLPGSGVAIDQSEAVLRRLRAEVPGAGAVGGDAMALPIATKAVDRVFAGHLYGHLEEQERTVFLEEARRVSRELVILDSGRPPGVNTDEWQTRRLQDGTSYRIYKRYFDIDTLLSEVGGEPLFSGPYYVMVRSTT